MPHNRRLHGHSVQMGWKMADIPELLSRIGWTRGRLARDIGVSEKTIQRWCNLPDSGGVGYMATRRYLEFVARVLGV